MALYWSLLLCLALGILGDKPPSQAQIDDDEDVTKYTELTTTTEVEDSGITVIGKLPVTSYNELTTTTELTTTAEEENFTRICNISKWQPTKLCPGSPRYKPHHKCQTLHLDMSAFGSCREACGSCRHYFCKTTTCITSYGAYLGIGETKNAPDDPCTSCQCILGDSGAAPPYLNCTTQTCDPPPAPNCIPIKHPRNCCWNWHCPTMPEITHYTPINLFCCDARYGLYNTSVCSDVVCTQLLAGSSWKNCRDGIKSVGEVFTTDECGTCVCTLYSSQCHINICPGSPKSIPHNHCQKVYRDTGEFGCCIDYICENTTCITSYERGNSYKYLSIGERKADPNDPCTSCQCVLDASGTPPPYLNCTTQTCPPPPAPNCIPIKYSGDCCERDWDCTNSYLLVTPKYWAAGGVADVCMFTPSYDNVDLYVKLQVKDYNHGHSLIFFDKDMYCANLSIPQTVASGPYSLTVSGKIGCLNINETRNIRVVSIAKTWVQTDKFLYLPGQLVQFRILTVRGPQFQVSYDEIPEVHITSPSDRRIAQWLNIDNSQGIVHLNFSLQHEPEEGEYTIQVETSNSRASQVFKVEPFVLPRFTVSITPPSYVLATDTEANFTVCASYTFGQPVKGYLNYNARPVKETIFDAYGEYRPSIITPADIGSEVSSFTMEAIVEEPPNFDGCQEVTITPADIASEVSSITMEAIVEEKGTGITAREEVMIQVQRSLLDFKKISKEEYYKFGLPNILQVRVSNPGNKPAVERELTVCVILWHLNNHICSKFSTDSNGILSAIIPSNIDQNIIEVKITCEDCKDSSAGFNNLSPSSVSYTFRRFFSPSGSSLSIVSTVAHGDCGLGRHVVIHINYVAGANSENKMWIMLISAGRIISATQHQVEFVSTPLYDPSKSQVIGGNLGNVNDSLVRGSTNMTVLLPNGISNPVKILAWYARSDGEVVAASTSLDVTECQRNPTSLSWKPGYPQEAGDLVNVTVKAHPGSICSLGVVDRSVELLSRTQGSQLSLATLTSLLQELESSWTQTDDQIYCTDERRDPRDKYEIMYGWSTLSTSQKDAMTAFDDSGVYVLSDLTIETRPCYIVSPPPVYLSEPPIPSIPHFGMGSGGESAPAQERLYFPETWLWKVLLVPNNGVWQEELELPDTITEWVGEGICVHPEAGLGVSNVASVITFSSFFLDLTIPPTIKQGEAVPLKISVFNYEPQTLPVTVELTGKGSYSILSPEGGTASLCIDSRTKEVTTMVLRPLDAGDVNLTVTAYVDSEIQNICEVNITNGRRDTVVREIKVKWEGVEKQVTKSVYLCASNDTNWQFIVPDNIVNGSARGFISVAADLMGPTIDNLEHLVRMPYGCGEQNMVGFTPNIFVMKYLTSSGLNTADITQRVTTNMEAGYIRELQYRHDDGSYSAFGSRDSSGSTWLTAFVLKSFAQARHFITVNEQDLITSQVWLESLQKEDGCFELVGQVFNKAMKGGLGGSDSDYLAPLSSYVLISLLEADMGTSSHIIEKAISCINNATLNTFYTEALRAYALTLSAEHNADDAITSAYNMVISEEDSTSSTSVVIEAMSYVLLAMMTYQPAHNNPFMLEIRELVHVITKHSNGEGGFISTQDTVVALQALAEFEVFQSSKTSLDVEVNRGEDSWTFKVDGSNRLLVQMESLDVKNAAYNVSVAATGQGCALVSSILRYNIPSYDDVEAFSAKIDVGVLGDCTTGIDVCASYVLPDGESNMAIMEFDLTTGFVPQEETLDNLVNWGIVKRYEVDEGLVTLYFDSITVNQTCIKFEATQQLAVADAKPATFTLYDYYDPELTISKNFLMDVAEECSD